MQGAYVRIYTRDVYKGYGKRMSEMMSACCEGGNSGEKEDWGMGRQRGGGRVGQWIGVINKSCCDNCHELWIRCVN